ncbi:uncharacterized protein FOMMEDRAFT_147607 [Fomitiporia mediterranea MF3/22]|uniref:uncharacterized protein n=1 Tax=Fomitiporia mediterranea (strain MF3/22) TaxID=694068 RepID=UPI00044084F8|nr:uncharacterized protein FOMMEDRAFT_147607 [Fomitiporia mediterranea MF3/22]EJD00908.1 hypothetical protein FOMMEDRAFT_147607 [Fomitiporia mediterranea MF3/22]
MHPVAIKISKPGTDLLGSETPTRSSLQEDGVVVGGGIQHPVSPGRQKCWQALSSRVGVGVGGGMQQPVSPGRQKWSHLRTGVEEVEVGAGTQQPVSPGRQMWSQTMVAAPTWLARNREVTTAEIAEA